MRVIRAFIREIRIARFMGRSYFEIKLKTLLEYGYPWNLIRPVLHLVNVATLVFLIYVLYSFLAILSPAGFGSKDIWDWLTLLVVPAGLTFGAIFINKAIREGERLQTAETITQESLQSYIEWVSDLLVKDVAEEREEQIRAVLRTQTIFILDRLASNKKPFVLRLLIESNLVSLDMSSLLINADFSQMEWPYVSITALNLRGINLSESKGHRVTFRDTIFSGGDFRNIRYSLLQATSCNFEYCNFDRADLFQAKFFGDNSFIRAKMNHADLRYAFLEDAVMRDVEFVGSNLRKARMRNAYLRRADFSDSNLTEVDLTRADLSRTRFDGAKLKGAILDGVNLTGSTISIRQLKSAQSIIGAFSYIDEEAVFAERARMNEAGENGD